MRRLIALCSVLAGLAGAAGAQTLQQDNAILFDQIKRVHHLTASQMDAVRDIFAGNPRMGQGNPAVTRHPMTPAQCAARIPGGPASYSNPRFERICGGPYMAPLYDPATQRPEDATSCIDVFEFPDIPCTYPVVWVKAREAAEICAAEGKRICDAHEWEGACQGELDPPDYTFGVSVQAQRSIHNARDAATARWSYGPAYQRGVCGANSTKTPGCNGGSFTGCGSNTYPTGSFPDCHSPLGVYDLNGNAAEHMNLPLAPSQMASTGSTTLGVTEMKGSWFIFDKFRAHPDWCRWRAPFWHGTQVMSTASHENYHLGFRCCKTLG